MKSPDLVTGFNYRGTDITVDWFDILEKSKIPDLPWQQIYAIANLDGEVPVVLYENSKPNLPGGGVEECENLDQALKREILEELNCEVIEWQPLGYQVNKSEKYGEVYQFRAVAKIKKLGEFKEDVGGSVIGYKTVKLTELNNIVQYGELGDRMVDLAKKSGFFSQNLL